jgi:Tfp pilus assembly protein PilF
MTVRFIIIITSILLLLVARAEAESSKDVITLSLCKSYASGCTQAAEAIPACNRAVETGAAIRGSKDYLATAFYGRAKVWFCGRQYERAIDDATSALKLAPREAILYVARGQYRHAAGQLDDATADLDQALKLSPNDFEAFIQRSSVWRDKGDLPAALRDISRAIEINPLNSVALASRCDLLRITGSDLKKALADCDASVRINAYSADVLSTRCAVRLALNDNDGALEDCNEALRLDAKLIAPLVTRGKLREAQGRADLATADYKSAIRLTPDTTSEKTAVAAARERLAALSTAPATVANATPAAAGQPAVAPPVGNLATPSVSVMTKAPGTVPASRRIALVIGNSLYRNVAPLPNPVRDATMIAEQLRSVGFQSVTLAKDLTRDALVDTLRKFAIDSENADWALVYYAGHGIEVAGLNYLIPVDAMLASDRAVAFETVPLEQAMLAVEAARKLRLVILDACRDNPFAQQMTRTVASRSIGRGLGSVEPEAGTLVVYSAKHGQIAMDGEVNSPFVNALAKRMTTPNLDIRRMFDYVRDDVMEATQHHQQPFTYGSLPGGEDFYFLAGK